MLKGKFAVPIFAFSALLLVALNVAVGIMTIYITERFTPLLANGQVTISNGALAGPYTQGYEAVNWAVIGTTILFCLFGLAAIRERGVLYLAIPVVSLASTALNLGLIYSYSSISSLQVSNLGKLDGAYGTAVFAMAIVSLASSAHV